MSVRLRAAKLEWRRVDDEIIAVDASQWTYLSANGSAALLWEALARGTTRDELVETLLAEFAIDRERAAADVDAFLADLAERGLLDETAA